MVKSGQCSEGGSIGWEVDGHGLVVGWSSCLMVELGVWAWWLVLGLLCRLPLVYGCVGQLDVQWFRGAKLSIRLLR